jgi:hypothetical protein
MEYPKKKEFLYLLKALLRLKIPPPIHPELLEINIH